MKRAHRGVISVIVWLAALGFLFAFIYFFYLARRSDSGQSFRQQYRDRRRNSSREEPINTDFQFENLTDDSAHERPGGPK